MRRLICSLTLLTLLTFDIFGQTKNNESTGEAIVDYVEHMASFPGGNDSLRVYIDKNLIKPTNIQKKGKVFVSFVVNANGTLTDFKIVRGLTEECDMRALEVVRKMPNWIPGTVNNISVRQSFILPIKFE